MKIEAKKPRLEHTTFDSFYRYISNEKDIHRIASDSPFVVQLCANFHNQVFKYFKLVI